MAIEPGSQDLAADVSVVVRDGLTSVDLDRAGRPSR